MKYKIIETKHDAWLAKVNNDCSKAFWDGFIKGYKQGAVLALVSFVLFVIWHYWR